MSKVFEPVLLPRAEKQRLCEELLAEFEIPIHTRATHRGELIVPCTLTDPQGNPLHRRQKTEPTGALNFEKLTYKCLGCGASGGLLWFIATHRGTSSVEVREWLGKETGTDGHLMELTSLLKYFDALYVPGHQREPIPTYSERMLDPWAFMHPWVTDPIEYDAEGRNVGGWGIPEDNAQALRFGYAEAYQYSQTTTSERIVVPHFWQDRLVGWQSRRITDDGTAKWKSSIDFPKDSTVYNYAPAEHTTAVVVESTKSVAKHLHHTHMVATFGKDITPTQVRLLGRYDQVIWWLDNDPGGWGAYADLKDNRGKITRLGIPEQTAALTNVWVVDSPYNADPADLDDETVQRLVADAVPWVIWQRPKVLLCHRCEMTAHEGGC